ncbi:hypothetical protein [Enterococcus sp. DIV1368e]|nr:hypothetical protein [Enterococcus mundtii]
MNEIQFLMYEDSEKVEVVVQDETIWATQKTISKLLMLAFRQLVNI